MPNYNIFFLLIFISLQVSVFASNTSAPIAIYLTWQHAPTTTMTVQWISAPESQDSLVDYQATGAMNWKSAIGETLSLPEGVAYLLHRVEITGLTPNTEYRFRIGKQGHPYKFLTMPSDLKTPVRFVAGGDIYHDAIEYVKETNIQAAKTSPHFALLGGDISYSASKDPLFSEDGHRWLTWLTAYQQTMITPEGRMIPMIVAIGNHDTRGRYHQPPEQAAFYYTFFALPNQSRACMQIANRPNSSSFPLRAFKNNEVILTNIASLFLRALREKIILNMGIMNLHTGPSYRAIDFGNYLSILVLDSGHTQPIGGAQSAWLEESLKMRQHVPHRLATYHVGAYPSVRHMDNKIAPFIREHWVPLFEKYQLHTAFEHHDHAYKRTFRMKDNKPDPKGVLYMGDGAWGVAEPRLPHPEGELWFLAKTASERHFILVSIENGKRTFTAINSQGVTFDNYEMKD